MDVLDQQELPTKFQRQVDCVVIMQTGGRIFN